jgi:hypothetical protein
MPHPILVTANIQCGWNESRVDLTGYMSMRPKRRFVCVPKRTSLKGESQTAVSSPAPRPSIKSWLDTPTSCMKHVFMGQGVSLEAMSALLAAPFVNDSRSRHQQRLERSLSRAKFSPRSDTNQIHASNTSFIPPSGLPTDAPGSGEALLELSSVLRWELSFMKQPCSKQ